MAMAFDTLPTPPAKHISHTKFKSRNPRYTPGTFAGELAKKKATPPTAVSLDQNRPSKLKLQDQTSPYCPFSRQTSANLSKSHISPIGTPHNGSKNRCKLNSPGGQHSNPGWSPATALKYPSCKKSSIPSVCSTPTKGFPRGGGEGVVGGDPAGAEDEDVAWLEGSVLGGGAGVQFGEGDGAGGEGVVGVVGVGPDV
ncbi:hypothetical protein LTR91_011193 [Friedmanniomyces endolithicus]|uniref:Uncharacterized protein n=1 Tax=Friedmanniomyces endolithicus TaxID=329885 RepID=A0AAN6QS84_9PEZI|nr:hypothetical protein LTR94_008018 [Friedmanniomyces endolithicus]KAK0798688.1 hypothetical protein LTR38_007777 [Friedmanniomyces endolithicus]KAK0813540.1 hypothetical protein LTR75_004635 [Friedmanniomyces endolithicus]KAK0854785.1 hypothetical protein LTR03_002219 [Friedmanniomyces endolithicus]KAK0868641.1 hypothetical protein LTS02_003482 [Friedmanniomyces endolithicus]